MSKLYNTYLTLKEKDSEIIYLFKSGIFFLAIEEDARKLSTLFHFKLGNLNDTVVKCGFPISSFNKYENLFKMHNLSIKIVEPDTNTLYKINDFKQNETIIDLLNFISLIDVNNLSVTEAYEWIEDLKTKANNLISNGDIK